MYSDCRPASPRKRALHADEEGRAVQRKCGEPRIEYVVEYQRNIQRATALVCPEMRADGMHVGCLVQDGQRISVTFECISATQRTSIRFFTEWPLIPGRYEGEAQEQVFVIVLQARPAQSLATADTVLRTPWTDCALQGAAITELQCIACGTPCAAFSSAALLRALPSENWEELVDAWMCHGDQKLNTSVTKGREGVDPMRIPAPEELWISSLLLKLASTQLTADTIVSPCKSIGPWEGDEYLVGCAQCHAVLGGAMADRAVCAVHFLQLSVRSSLPLPSQYFGQVLANYLVEQAGRHAVHQFHLVPMNAPNSPGLLLWLFQPSLEIYTEGCALHACKILYYTTHTAPHVPAIQLYLPQAHCSLLQSMLERSTAMYPTARKALAEWRVGWLARGTL